MSTAIKPVTFNTSVPFPATLEGQTVMVYPSSRRYDYHGEVPVLEWVTVVTASNQVLEVSPDWLEAPKRRRKRR